MVPRFEQLQRVLRGPMPRLDAIRGIAVSMVMLAHFVGSYPAHSTPEVIVQGAVRSGWCGVDLFFVLSGALITGILLESRPATNYFSAFYMRRVLRIFPLYYGLLFMWFIPLRLFVVARGWNADAIGVAHQAYYWLYISNWLPLFAEGPGALGHLWSLGVEEQFYLVWPFVVWLLPRRKLGALCLALIVGAPLLRCLLVAVHVPSLAIYELTPARADSLAWGALIAVAFRDEAWMPIVARSWRAALGAALLILAAVAAWLRGLPNDAPLMQTLGFSSLACAAAAIIAGAILDSAALDSPATSRWRLLRALGKYSYALYILHHPIYSSLLGRLTIFRNGALLESPTRYLLFMTFCFALSLGLAVASWYLLESPFLRLKRRFVPNNRQTDAQP